MKRLIIFPLLFSMSMYAAVDPQTNKADRELCDKLYNEVKPKVEKVNQALLNNLKIIVQSANEIDLSKAAVECSNPDSEECSRFQKRLKNIKRFHYIAQQQFMELQVIITQYLKQYPDHFPFVIKRLDKEENIVKEKVDAILKEKQ